MMTNYIVRSIDRKLWTKVKKQAASDDLSLRAVILALLRGYAAGALVIAALPAPPAEGGS
jgi:hypothetical protein